VGYRGTRDLLFEIGNIFLANDHEHSLQGRGLDGSTEGHHAGSHAKA
jgi:nitrogenase molybdenum-iron protein NifN